MIAEVVIVGAGVMGTSAAYHLAARGVKNILVLDRSLQYGSGSTGRATGGFRAQYSSAINIQLSLLTRAKLRSFAMELGVDPGYQPAGYLWLASDQRQLAVLRRSNEVQQQLGLHEARIVSCDEIARINPAVSLARIAGGAFCSSDGFIKPLAILDGYRRGAERLGVQFALDSEVVSLERARNGAITAVLTKKVRIAAERFVNACGAWAGRWASWGVPIPVTALCRQVVPTVETAVLPTTMPMTIFCENGFHLRVRDCRVLLLWPTPRPGRDPFDDRVDPTWIDSVVEQAAQRVPVLRDVAIDREQAWAGLYEMTPDHHALLGRHSGCDNLYLIGGGSGHGVMHAPALGELLAEIMLDGNAKSLDAAALAPDRFERGCANETSELL